MIATFTHLTGSRRGLCERFLSDQINIGRATDNALCFGDHERRVSAHHAQIKRHNDSFLLRDLGSTNGTMINGRRVIISELEDGDLLEVGAGGPLLRFGLQQPAQETEAAGNHEPEDNSPSSSGNWETAALKDFGLIRKRYFEKQKNNVRLISAIGIAMIFGAAFGIWLSLHLKPVDRFRVIAARNSAAVVFIQTEFELLDQAGNVVASQSRTGTGFIISADGLIVTNRHVIRDWDYHAPMAGITGRTKSIFVILEGKTPEAAIPATLAHLSSDKDKDVVILRIAAPANLPVIYGVDTNLGAINQGDEVAAIGYPLGLGLLPDHRLMSSFTTGVVSRVGQDLIQLDLRAYHGNSGSPVLNQKGEVIGIITANVSEAPDIVFCTPIGLAYEIINISH